MRTPSRSLLCIVFVSLLAVAFSADLSAAAAANPPDAASNASRGVLIDFTASWCGPCQQMSPVVNRLHREGYPVRKVDVDQNPEIARQFNVRSIPAFVLVVDGKEVTRVVGMTSESRLKQLLARIPASVSPPVAVADRGDARPEPARSSRTGDRARGTVAQGPGDEPLVRANFDREETDGFVATELSPQELSMAASTRIRVRDEDGVNFGSGTIVHSRPGHTVILSCGHIFRQLRKDSTIEVDVFHDGRYETFHGKVLRYDLEADVGLIAIPTDRALPACPVAAARDNLALRDRVTSIGCGKGDPPTRMRAQVTALNRYLGPDNVECTGVPIQGRSGGGLFDEDGEVVGVCIAADPRDQRGLYAGLAPIHALLDAADLAHVHRTPLRREPPRVELAAVEERPAPRRSVSGEDRSRDGRRSGDEERSADEHRNPAAVAALPAVLDPETVAAAGVSADQFLEPHVHAVSDPSGALDETLQAALEQVGEAEVICIIRPHDNPQANSRVVIINRASPKFVSYLAGELEQQPQQTSERSDAAAEPPSPRTAENAPNPTGGEDQQFLPPRRYQRSR